MRILFTLLISISFASWGQKAVYLHLNPKVNGVDLQLNTTYTALDGKAFKLDHFDYYLSEILLKHDAGQEVNLNQDIYLVEPENHTFLLGNFNVDVIEQLNFTVGVPKKWNMQSGVESQDISLYPETHPLSFQTPSMYWGWLSGYMHMIIGGFSDSHSDGDPDAYFELHNLGGSNQQIVELNVTQTNTSSNQIDIYVDCNIEQWIKNIPLATVGVSHDEVGLNKTILDNVQVEPVFTLAAVANLTENAAANFTLWTSSHELFVNLAELKNVGKCSVIDLSGRLVQTQSTPNNEGTLSFKNLSAGFYLIQLEDTKGNLIAAKKTLIP
jgi:hypothetical protein